MSITLDTKIQMSVALIGNYPTPYTHSSAHSYDMRHYGDFHWTCQTV